MDVESKKTLTVETRPPLQRTPNALIAPKRGARSVAVIEEELKRLPHLPADRRLEKRDRKAEFRESQQAKTAGEALAKIPGVNETIHMIISGRFALFDFVPAALAMSGCKVDALHIATLGFSTRNVVKLVDLVDAELVRNVWLLCSHYFAGTSAKIYDAAADEFRKRPGRMEFLSIRTHAKILLIAFDDGRRLTLESSANLRSCKNIEQASAFGDPDVYEFHRAWIDDLFVAARA